MPAGSRVREKSRFRLYSARAGARAADRVGALFRAALFFTALVVNAGFGAVPRWPTRLVVARFLVAGRFTARLDVFLVAMGTPLCEERAHSRGTVGPADDQ
jgi:hypothetical protein